MKPQNFILYLHKNGFMVAYLAFRYLILRPSSTRIRRKDECGWGESHFLLGS